MRTNARIIDAVARELVAPYVSEDAKRLSTDDMIEEAVIWWPPSREMVVGNPHELEVDEIAMAAIVVRARNAIYERVRRDRLNVRRIDGILRQASRAYVRIALAG